MSYKNIGNYIQRVNKRNKDLAISNLLGVSIQKKFIVSVANTTETDMSNYRIIKRNQFAYSPVTSRNGDKITIALMKDFENTILSPAYTVFEVKDENEVIPEYLFMWFNRTEFDRYARFNSWGSARETFDWSQICEIEIPIPDIEVQKKYVATYKGLLNNQKSYENSLDDLQLICDSYIENLIKNKEAKLLRDYIQKINDKNDDNSIKEVKGLSVNKTFRTPKSTVNRDELSNYRIVRNKQFAYVQTTNNEKKLVIALSHFDYPIVVSSVNVVFKIKDENQLLPEFLFLFFMRNEFDRYARFHSWGSARETFDWEEMCNVKLPIPDIGIQKAIVNIYHVLEARKKINLQLKDSIKLLCPVLMQGVVESDEIH